MKGYRTIVAAALFAGCIVYPTAPPPRGVAVSGPPPAPVEEPQPPRPSPSALWVSGYWHWNGFQYVWVPGHWEVSPPQGHWRPPRYEQREGTYFYESGGWR
ncbi:MAG: hypothetical protein WCI05_03460 [Myxococcales bacterium]